MKAEAIMMAGVVWYTKRTGEQERWKWDRITSNRAKWVILRKTAVRLSVEKAGEKWGRDMRGMYEKWVTSKQPGREPVCVFLSPSKWVELVISSQQHEMWEQVQLLFPRWLQGNSSHLLCLRLSRSGTVQRTTSKCVLLFSFSVVCQNWTCFCLFFSSSPDLIWPFSHSCCHVKILFSFCDFDVFLFIRIFYIMCWMSSLFFGLLVHNFLCKWNIRNT